MVKLPFCTTLKMRCSSFPLTLRLLLASSLSIVISLEIDGNNAVRVISLDSVIVSAPLPAAQLPVAVSVLAAVIASDRLQVELTVMLAA